MFFEDFEQDCRYAFCFDEISKIEGMLFADERAYIGNAVSSRVQEFTAGRVLARKSLAKWGKENSPILVGKNRMPIFPETTIGSISHTAKYVAVVSAQANVLASIGIDIEHIGKVTEDLWHLLLKPDEIAFVKKNGEAFWATLFFSAKEAFFKMQYPLTQQMLDFKDVEIIPNLKKQTLTVICQDKKFENCEGFYSVCGEVLCSLFLIFQNDAFVHGDNPIGNIKKAVVM